VFHSLNPFWSQLIRRAPASVMTVWSGWGGDYYGPITSRRWGLLGPRTAQFERSRFSVVGKAVRWRREWIFTRTMGAAARSVDVFSAPIPEDLAVFTRRYRGFRGRYSQLNYASVEDTFATGSRTVSGDDILLGNSATLPNNHLDVLESLAELDLGGRRVIAPLSYGDASYGELVSRRGSDLLGASFVPLRDFLPLEEYRELIAGCGVVVMGHRRQQGIGNVAGAMWSGAHVFLDPANPLLSFFRSRGGVVGTLPELLRDGLPARRLDEASVSANRDVLQGFWGREVVIDNIRSLLAADAR